MMRSAGTVPNPIEPDLADDSQKPVNSRTGSEPPNKRKMQVLFVIDQLSVLGGGERAMLQMIRGLSSRFQCSVVTFRNNLHPELPSLLDAPITVIPLRKTYSLRGIRGAFHLARIIRRERIDVVHTFFETSDLFGGVVAKLAGVKVLISSRRDMGLLRSAKHRLAYRLIGRSYNRVITVSNAVRQYVLACDRLDPNRVTTVYTGVRTPVRVPEEQLCALRTRLEIPRDAPVVLTVANILPWKGHHEFLAAAALVHRCFPLAHFVVAGACNHSELLKDLENERAELDLNACFHFAGGVRPIDPMYQLASAFCLLSETEGLPNALLEAMAAGLPAVVTRVGGSRELVANGKTGFLVEPGSARDAAECICEVLAAPLRASQMAVAARCRAMADFSMEAMFRSLEAIYDASFAE